MQNKSNYPLSNLKNDGKNIDINFFNFNSGICKKSPKLDDKKDVIVPYSGEIAYNDDLNKKIKKYKILEINIIPLFEENISEILQKMNINKEIINFLSFSKNEQEHYKELENIRNKLFLKENKLRIKNKEKFKKFIVPSKLGRKNKNDESYRAHNKYKADNIIKAIKTKLNHSLILFLNRLINSIYCKAQINQILSEFHISRIKIDTNLKLVKVLFLILL